MRTSRYTRFVPALLLALTLVAAACSNDPETESQPAPNLGDDPFADLERVEAPSPCTNDPGVSDDTITVGAIMAKSGAAAQSFSRAEDGMRARFELANTTGELGDRTLELVVADDAGDAARNVTAARELVERSDVFGVMEISTAADASGQYFFDNDVPVTGWHLAQPAYGMFPNFFSFNGVNPDPDKQKTTRNAEVLKMLGATKIAIVGGGPPVATAFARQIAETVDADPDLDVVYETFDVPIGQTEFTGEVEDIKQSGADGLYTGMDFLQNAALNEQLKQADADVPIVVFPGGYDPLALDVTGLDGAYFGVEFKPFELEAAGFQDFQEAMADRPIGQVPFVGWLSADIFIEGLKAAGIECPTREGFINNLRLVDDYTANDALLPIDFSEQFGRHFLCSFYVHVEDGAFVPQFDGEPVCGEPFEG
ncbi:MAG: ABC transporter substrate-binding protein [Acidimicrobiia bacterium]